MSRVNLSPYHTDNDVLTTIYAEVDLKVARLLLIGMKDGVPLGKHSLQFTYLYIAKLAWG